MIAYATLLATVAAALGDLGLVAPWPMTSTLVESRMPREMQERAIQRREDGSVAIRSSGSGTIIVGPLPESVSEREMIWILSQLQVVVASGYPSALLERGVGGTALVGMRVDWSGAVLGTRIDRTSGNEDLDFAALQVAAAMAFGQVPSGTALTQIWIAVPVQFEAA